MSKNSKPFVNMSPAVSETNQEYKLEKIFFKIHLDTVGLHVAMFPY